LPNLSKSQFSNKKSKWTLLPRNLPNAFQLQ
jgi:hypothetical protein